MQYIIYMGIVIIIIILGLMVRSINKGSNITIQKENSTIDDQKLYDYLLPNNRGRSIDYVISRLKELGIDPDFHVNKD